MTPAAEHAGTGPGLAVSGRDPATGRVLRLHVTRRADAGLEPDVDKLVELVLDIAETRYRAHLAGQPDPYGPAAVPAPEDRARRRPGSAVLGKPAPPAHFQPPDRQPGCGWRNCRYQKAE